MLDNCGGSGGPFDPGPVTTCDETGGVIFTGSTQVPNNYGIGGLNEPPIGLPGEIIDVTGTCGFACWPKNIFATMGRWGDPRFGNPQGVPAAAPVGPAIVPPAKKDPNHACVGNSICPAHWEGKTPPPGLGRYFGFGGEWFYHCDAHVFVETNCTSSGWDFDQSILHGECAYDRNGTCGGKVGDLITEDNPLCGHCVGNADRFDQRRGFLKRSVVVMRVVRRSAALNIVRLVCGIACTRTNRRRTASLISPLVHLLRRV